MPTAKPVAVDVFMGRYGKKLMGLIGYKLPVINNVLKNAV
jgi:hypothetical protein